MWTSKYREEVVRALDAYTQQPVQKSYPKMSRAEMVEAYEQACEVYPQPVPQDRV